MTAISTETLLALDCSTHNCSAALVARGRLYSYAKARRRAHHKLILPMIDRLLKQAGISAQQVDSIICGTGPGSFVGLRIALGVAQGFALAQEIKLTGVSSLDALACRALTAATPGATLDELASGAEDGRANGALKNRDDCSVIAAIDAKQDELYYACYEVRGGRISRTSEPAIFALNAAGDLAANGSANNSASAAQARTAASTAKHPANAAAGVTNTGRFVDQVLAAVGDDELIIIGDDEHKLQRLAECLPHRRARILSGTLPNAAELITAAEFFGDAPQQDAVAPIYLYSGLKNSTAAAPPQ